MSNYFDELETRNPQERERDLMARLPQLVAQAQTAPGWARILHGVTAGDINSRAALALNLGETLPDNELEMLAAAALPDADADTLAALVASAQGNTRRLTKMLHGVVRTARLNNMPVNAGIVKKYSGLIIR